MQIEKFNQKRYEILIEKVYYFIPYAMISHKEFKELNYLVYQRSLFLIDI